MRQDGGLWLEGERDEAGKARRLVLQPTQLSEMINTLLERFDVAVEHGAGAPATHGMPRPMDLQPLVRVFFAPANLVTHALIKNLRASPGDGAEPRFAEHLERLANRRAKDTLREVPHLNSGEGLDVKVGI